MKTTINSGGIQDSYLGIKYQLDLLSLSAHQSYSSGVNFKLSTEQRNVGCFDDIVLEATEGGKIRYVFGQAKYRKAAVDLDFRMLLSDKNFNLSKYFESWLKIIVQNQYKNCVKDIYIITNIQINAAQTLPNGLVQIDSNITTSSLYFTEDTSADLIFKDVGLRYKFPGQAAFPAERQAVFHVLKNEFLVKFAQRSNFDDILNSFMDQLVFVTSLETKDIHEKIKKDLQTKFEISNVSAQYLKMEECIKNLIDPRGNKRQIIIKDYDEIFHEYELFENTLSVMKKTSGIFHADSLLEFQTIHKDIEEFLDPQINQTNNILHVKAQEFETEFVSMQIYKKLSTTAVNKDTYIMMKTSFNEETFELGVKVFEMSESFKFMIIEVDLEDDSLFEKFRSQVEKTLQSTANSKRLIVITQVNSKVQFSSCSELKVDHVYPKDLNDEGGITKNKGEVSKNEGGISKMCVFPRQK